jgi:NAD(P)-dependent dehydrogenase (short-subunit alcohol dehydrogenase family)
MFDFRDEIVVVTGAAGNLGSAVVKIFLQNGATVCGMDYKQGRLNGLENFTSTSGNFHVFEEIDIMDREGMRALAQDLHDQVGKADVLVNTVGGFTFGEQVHGLSPETWERMMSLNVQSFLNLTHAFVPDLLDKGQGKVISIGSRSSLKGSAKTGAYAAAKSALLRLTESMAAELLPHHIQVNCVLPGTIDTPENREAMPNADFEKWVTLEELAETILFLASPGADGINGAAIPVYGSS